MINDAFEHLLEQARHTHQKFSALSDFCQFPADLSPLEVTKFHIAAAEELYTEVNLSCRDLVEFRDAFIKAGPHACWREPYKGTTIGEDFLARFACYPLIGEAGAWISKEMCAYMVYMPPHLYYPWHHHLAEEIYFVVAGEGEFMRDGMPTETLKEGQSAFHESNQPHALQTRDHPVMAYVLWRNHLDSPAVLTETSDLTPSKN